MNAEAFDKQFDEGKSIIAALDLPKAKRLLQTQRRVSVGFPMWMVNALDREAGKIGVTRQSIIKVWLAERLESTAAKIPPQLASR